MGVDIRMLARVRHVMLLAAVILGAALTVLVAGAGSSAAASARAGDADCNGTVDGVDALLALQAGSGLEVSAGCLNQADADCSGHIAVADALIILRSLAGFTSTVSSTCPRIGSLIPREPAASDPATPTPSTVATTAPTPTASPSPTSSPTPRPSQGSGGMPALPQAWVGVNVWGLAAADSEYSCGSAGGSHQQFLDNTLNELRGDGVDVVRFWAFQAYAKALGSGTRDWSALDRVFASAQAHGVYLIPVLDNYWDDCDYWPVSLWPNGHRHDGYNLSPAQWISEVVQRYANNPAVLLWEVENEPEAASHSASDVAAFQSEMAGLVSAVKAADPGTPVSLGNIGSGQHGFSNTAYKATFLASGADWATAHDYQDWNTPIPWSNSCDWNSMCSDLKDAKSMGVPFYIGETGSDTCDNSAKANALRAKIQAYHAQGAVGVIYWAFDIRTRAGNCGFDVGPGGPVMAVFKDF